MTEYNEDVIKQLHAVRESGKCNMMDRPCIRDAATQIGFEELVEFIDESDAKEFHNHLEEMGRRLHE